MGSIRNKEFISLGPSCIPAEILKTTGLRSCTYGFDWFRSGGYFVQKYLELPTEEFLSRYVYQPCVPMIQPIRPTAEVDSTVEAISINPIYGFNYLYNPHRDYLKDSTKEYFKRAFYRLKKTLENKQIQKNFILADYINKEGYTFLNKYETIIQFLSDVILKSNLKSIEESEIFILRIQLAEEDDRQLQIKKSVYEPTEKNLSIKANIFEISYPNYLDDIDIRNLTYRIIGNRIFKEEII